MALSEKLTSRRLSLLPNFRKSPDSSIPLADQPELKPGKKGYLIISTPTDPLDPESTAYSDNIPAGLLALRLDITPSEPRLTEYVVYNPSVAEIVTERFSIFDNLTRKRAIEDAKTRADILRRAGYSDFTQREYTQRVILIAARKVLNPSSPAGRTSL